MRGRTVAAGLGIAAVITAVVIGLVMLGPPSEQRARRLDERRVRSLQELRVAIDQYWRGHGRLPESVADVMKEPANAPETTDPVTGRAYAYRVVTGRTYQLCAEFERSGPAEPDVRLWAHPAGTHCFDLEVRDGGRGQ